MLLIASSAIAQEEPAQLRRGGSGFPPSAFITSDIAAPDAQWMLLRWDVIKNELKLSELAIDEIGGLIGERRTALQSRPSREEADQLKKDFALKVSKILTEQQKQRLLGIFLQMVDVSGVVQADVQAKVDFTDEQKAKLKEIIGSVQRAGWGRFSQRATAQINDLLTTEQKKKLEELKGEKFDLEQLRRSSRRDATQKEIPAAKWEYKVVKTTNTDLAEYGDEGWELVSVVTPTTGSPRQREFYFKRPMRAAANEQGNRQIGSDEKFQRWAEGLIRLHDSDKDGALSVDEIEDKSAMRFDRNADGKVQAPEMVEFLKNYQPNAAPLAETMSQ